MPRKTTPKEQPVTAEEAKQVTEAVSENRAKAMLDFTIRTKCLSLSQRFRRREYNSEDILRDAAELYQWCQGQAVRAQVLEMAAELAPKNAKSIAELQSIRDRVYDFLVGQPSK